MNPDQTRDRAPIEAQSEPSSRQIAEAERTRHAEERELPPQSAVKPVENLPDGRLDAPECPPSRHGDQR